jgi:uncharacterized secreted protein with C-terminal beta-propeller domain
MRYLISTVTLMTTLGLIGCVDDSKNIDVDAALKNSSELETYLKKGLISKEPSGDHAYSETDAQADGTMNDATSDGDYSTTNTQEATVDEADIVKQNGDYLYAYAPQNYSEESDLNTIKVYRTEANPVTSSLVYEIPLPTEYSWFDGMYLLEDSLVTLSQSGSYSIYYDTPETAVDLFENGEQGSTPSPRMEQVMAASLSFMNIDNPAQPEQTYNLEFEGNMISSRRHGDYLYLINRFTPLIPYSKNDTINSNEWTQKVLDIPLSQLLPRYWINGELAGRMFTESGCYLPELDTQGGYHNLISLIKIDLTNPSQWQAQCSSGRVEDIYVSDSFLFLTAGYYQEGTRIDQFSLEDLTLAATGTIPGFLQWPMPRYRMSEKDGYLRVLVSHQNFGALIEPAIVSVTDEATSLTSSALSSSVPSWEDAHHRLYVLKANAQQGFDQVAVIPNTQQSTVIGKPGEQIKAVRYRGERAYIVTYRQTDPLYVINLSNPTNPYVEGELEIEGFSQYLHPINDTLLLGLGINADNSGRNQGLKATLFDVSNSAQPSEISSQLFAERWSSAGYLYDPKAVSFLTSGEENDLTTRVAFTWRQWTEGYQRELHMRVMDIHHTSQNMQLNNDYTYSVGKNNYETYSRALLHSDGVHLVSDGEVTSGTVDSFQ